MRKSVTAIFIIISIPITILGNGLGDSVGTADSSKVFDNDLQDSLKIERTTSVYRSLNSSQIENIATRSISDFISLQPGVVIYNRQIFIRGGRSDETGYQIEGISSGVMIGSSSQNYITTIPEAIENISVLTGVYSADIGGAASGIVQQTFKTGDSSMQGSFRYETDKPASGLGDSYSYGYEDLTATLSGPLGDIRYFIALQKQHKDDYNPQFNKGFDFGYLKDTGNSGGTMGDSALVKWESGKVTGRNDDRLTLNSSLQYNTNQLNLRLTGVYSTRERRLNTRSIYNIFNEGRLPQRDDLNMLLTGKIGYNLSSNTSLNGRVSLLRADMFQYDPNFITDGVFDLQRVLDSGDSLEVAKINKDWVYRSRFTGPPNYYFAGFTFPRPGKLMSGYFKKEQSNKDISLALVTNIENHEITIGGAYQSWVIRQYDFPSSSIPNLQYYLKVDTTFKTDLQAKSDRAIITFRRARIGGYGYDEFGDILNDGLNDAKRPKFTSVYIIDRIHLKSIIVNAGIRIEKFDLDSWHLSDPANPMYNVRDHMVNLEGESKSVMEIQPRIGIAVPIGDHTVLNINYGKFAHSPDLIYGYATNSEIARIMAGQDYISEPIGFDLKPIVSNQTEIRIDHDISNKASLGISAFYKIIKGQLVSDRYEILPEFSGVSYNVLINRDKSIIKGLELSLFLKRIRRFQMLINYSLTSAIGFHSFPYSNIGEVENSTITIDQYNRLRFDQRHHGSLILDYRFLEIDNSPFKIFALSGLNLFINFNSGNSLTRMSGSFGAGSVDRGGVLYDERNTKPSEPVGSSKTPWVFTTNLKLDKSIVLGNFKASLYFYVSNLFNRQNALNVYNRTGDPYDDGFLTDPDLSGYIVESFGETYVALHEAINLENRQHWIRVNGLDADIFGPPRQIRFGMLFKF